MITYPTIFFGIGTGPLKEDFEEYSVGSLPVYDQIWQYAHHQWLTPKNPTKYVGFTWKDRGISGANDDFEHWNVGSVNLNSGYDPYMGQGNFETRPWVGLSAGFYKDSKGQFASADQLREYDYVNFNWGNNPPLSGYKVNFWSAKFIAKLTLPLNGTYQLYVERDQAARVFVGRENGPDTMIFDGWTTPPPGVKEACSPITYSAGLIDIVVDFYEDTDPSKLKLYWSMPTVSGGGPTTNIALITPKYFGNSGYIGSFCTEGVFNDTSKNKLDFQGSYISSALNLGPYRGDYSYENLNLSGHYSLGVIYNDRARENTYNKLSHAGYYSPKNIYQFLNDSSKNQIDSKGVYIYHSVDVKNSDLNINKLDAKGFYGYQSALAYGTDAAKSQIGFDYGNYFYRTANFYIPENVNLNIQTAGIYIVGITPTDELVENSINTIEANGNYSSIFAPYYFSDFCVNYTNINGVYFPSRVNEYQNDFSLTQINPSGYYVKGFINTDALQSDQGFKRISLNGGYFTRYPAVREKEPSYNFLNYVGYYASSTLIEYIQDPALTNIDFQGSNTYRFISGSAVDIGNNLQDFDGSYFYRFAFSDISYDNGCTLNDLRGIYIDRYAKIKEDEPAKDEIDFKGNYYPRYGAFNFNDQGKHLIGFDAVYYYGRAPNYECDIASNLVSLNGDLKYRFVGNEIQDPAYNSLGFIDARYFYARVPVRYQDPSCNLLQLAGDYSRDSWVSKDSTVLEFDFESEFIPYISKTNSLSYWIESKEASFYNMNKTLIYFGV